MRRWFTIMILAVTAGVSLTLLLAAVYCARSTTVHMPQPGLARCHQHQPVSHLPLWRLATVGLVPAGLLWLGWRFYRQTAFPLRAGTAVRQSIGPEIVRAAQPPPPYLAEAMADGLHGGRPAFG